jgi:hypothetical protein
LAGQPANAILTPAAAGVDYLSGKGELMGAVEMPGTISRRIRRNSSPGR